MQTITADQWTIFILLGVTLVLFIWNRWRYDVVALMALMVVAVTGLVPVDALFAGLGHPAVVTVMAVLVLSRGLLEAGVVDLLARQLTRAGDQPWLQVVTLTGVVALCSGFMNNVGALALFMPVAIWMSRQSGTSPSTLLMPLAFGSLLGGTLTMIGTPPNIIIAAYRETGGQPAFGMFDFLPVGLAVTLIGVAFISLLGWRLTPRREQPEDADELLDIGAYLTELRVTEDSKFAGQTLHRLLEAVKEEGDILIVGLVRDDRRQQVPSTYEVLRAGDIVQVEADSESLERLLDLSGLVLAHGHEQEAAGDENDSDAKDDKSADDKREQADLSLAEAVVASDSCLVGTNASALYLRERYGVNILAVARRGHRVRARLGKIRFAVGDILLVQAPEDSLQSALNQIGCLPLASRGLRMAKPRQAALAATIFILSLVIIALGWLDAATALVGGALVMMLAGVLKPADIYQSIDWPVIVLLAAMLPVGGALETTGGSRLIADALLSVGQSTAPAITLAVIMAAVMLLSNVVNNAAAAILAAPVAISLANSMNVSADPLLMSVAIGASCAFLTPIGHQSNTLVMAPGGYEFGDYWRMGLPLSLLVIAVAVPSILWVWPL